MLKDEIVEYIESSARAFQTSVYESVTVTRLRRDESDALEISTDIGDFTADQVIIATGGYQEATIPRMAERFPQDLFQIHSSDYKNPAQFPDGEVMIVGSGQSGCLIAEDLHRAGRRVHLCVGGAPRTAGRMSSIGWKRWVTTTSRSMSILKFLHRN